MATVTPTPAGPPASATHALSAWSGCIAMLAACTALNFYGAGIDIADKALIVMGAAAFGVFVPDLAWQRVYRRTLSATANAGDLERLLTKLIGLIATGGLIWLAYAVFPEYQGNFYSHYWHALHRIVPTVAVLSLPYLYWVDRHSAQPRDALWRMGRLTLLHPREVNLRVVGQYLLGWLVKAFFLPLMFTYLCDNLDKLLHYDLKLLHSFFGVYDWAFFTLYFIDVSLVSMTYLMSLRLTDTHIRSTEPTMLGWAAALLCYQPFWSLFGGQYLTYDTGPAWDFWLRHSPWLFDFWGCLILTLVVIYVWATVSFGGRFSNLTHRGIITNGPYRFTRHPAYIAKNLSWWLVSMPFMLFTNVSDMLRHCVMLLALNGIYYLRAKTEERHLSLDPAYAEYARWIEQHGALRFLNRVPGLRALARWQLSFKAYEPPSAIDTRR